MSYYWPKYVPAAKRRTKTLQNIKKLQKEGMVMQPVEVDGRTIAKSFWGKAWCTHLESFSDYENRLPRGRTYLRNGSVCHLDIEKGQVKALVSGKSLYSVRIEIKPLEKSIWDGIKQKCSGKIGSMLELLKGQLSDNVMSIVTDHTKGLLPQPGEMKFDCTCPDWADMCKHVAAVLYGVGSRLDSSPELLFALRGVDAGELISAGIGLPDCGAESPQATIADNMISDIFGIDMDESISEAPKESIPEQTPKTIATQIITFPKPAVSFEEQIPFTGKSLKLMRKNLRLTVREFAKEMNVSTTTIYLWQRKRKNIKTNHVNMQKMNELYKKSISDI